MVRTDDGVKISLRLHRQGERRSALIICPGFFQSQETKTFRHLAEALFRNEPERFTRLMQEWFGQTLTTYLGG